MHVSCSAFSPSMSAGCGSRYARTPDLTEAAEVTVDDGKVREVEIDGFEPNMTYFFRFRALNAVGERARADSYFLS